MGSKPSGTTTSTQNTTPWGPQQPYLEDIFTNSQGLYQGTPPQYYPGATTAPENYPQQSSLGWMTATADASGQYPWEAAGFNSDLLNGTYLNSNPAMGLYGGFAGSNYASDPSNPAFGTENYFLGHNLGYELDKGSALHNYANGDYVSQDNPYTDDLVKSITSRVLPGIQSQFINGGALNSAEAARASTEGVGSAIAPELFKRQQQEEQNQIAASEALAGHYMQGGALQAQMARELANQGLQGRGLQQQAAAGLGSTYSGGIEDMIRGLQLSPQTYQSLFAPSQAVFGAGSAQQQFDQQAINDAVQRWNFQQSLPWDMLNQYIGQVTGNYGGTTTLNQPYFTNPTQSIASGLGAAGSLFSIFSDRRMKEDINRVGTLDNGLPVYSFRYIGDPVSHIGLMADEVEEVRPEAVVEGPFGFKMVNYAEAVT